MRDIRLFTLDTNTNEVGYTIGASSAPIYGRSNLAQRVIKIVLTQLGSDAFFPDLGTSIKELQKLDVMSDTGFARTVAARVIKQAEQFIKTDQTAYDNLTSEEILDKIEVMDVSFDGDKSMWKFKLAVYAGNGTLSVLEF